MSDYKTSDDKFRILRGSYGKADELRAQEARSKSKNEADIAFGYMLGTVLRAIVFTLFILPFRILQFVGQYINALMGLSLMLFTLGMVSLLLYLTVFL